MDYIIRKINEKSNLWLLKRNFKEASTHQQSCLEYILIKTLAYYWNRNLNSIDAEQRQSIYRDITNPSIGTIVKIIRILCSKEESFKKNKFKKFAEIIDKYPQIRNERIGHGYSFEDQSAQLSNTFKELYHCLLETGPDFIKNDCDVIHTHLQEDDCTKGAIYKPDGSLSFFSIPIVAVNLEVNCIYLIDNNNYIKLTPFVVIENTDEFYLYSFIQDRMASKAIFNRIIKSGRRLFHVNDLLPSELEIDSFRRMAGNGTIVNNYENNYKKYIDSSIVKKLIKFLKKNRSTVFSTVWGHGGVGKTAAIQRVCESLLNDPYRQHRTVN